MSVHSPTPGHVTVTILSHSGDGTASAALLEAVKEVLNHEDVRPLTDLVTVRPATIIPYQVAATLTLYDGPDGGAALAAARSALARYVQNHHRLGHDITISGLHAALHQPGVQNVRLIAPAADIVVGSGEVAFCPPSEQAVSMGGHDV